MNKARVGTAADPREFQRKREIMLPLLPLFLACLLSAHGLRKKSLSPSGAFTALLVGFLMLGGAIYVFGATLIGFYLIGSRATKCE